MTLTQGRSFKIGDDVIAFEWKQEAFWKPAKCFQYEGEVLAVKGNKVYVDTPFGILPFDAKNVEYDDVPF